MARLRDLKVGMKVEIVKASDTANIGLVGKVGIIDNNDSMRSVFVEFDERPSGWCPASWIKIIKDEGETKLTKAQTETEVKTQKYVLMGHNYVSQVFTDSSTKGISDVANDMFSKQETIELLKDGDLKLFKIEEVKLEIAQPSIKIIG